VDIPRRVAVNVTRVRPSTAPAVDALASCRSGAAQRHLSRRIAKASGSMPSRDDATIVSPLVHRAPRPGPARDGRRLRPWRGRRPVPGIMQSERPSGIERQPRGGALLQWWGLTRVRRRRPKTGCALPRRRSGDSAAVGFCEFFFFSAGLMAVSSGFFHRSRESLVGSPTCLFSRRWAMPRGRGLGMVLAKRLIATKWP